MSELHGALLPPEAGGPLARPLRSWSASSRERLARAVDDALSQWRRAWGLPEPFEAGRPVVPGMPVVACEPASEACVPAGVPELGAWRPVDDAGWGVWWAPRASPSDPPRTHESLLTRLSALLFGERARPIEPRGPAAAPAAATASLASDVARAAWADCCARISRALGAPSGTSPAPASPDLSRVLRPWSGAVVLTAPWWEQRIVLLLAGERVDAFLASAPQLRRQHSPKGELTPVLGALAGHAARVSVQTLSFELEVGALASARVGDVLRTTHAIGTPLIVNAPGPDGRSPEAICGAYLGKAGDDRAVELMRFPPPSSAAPGARERAP